MARILGIIGSPRRQGNTHILVSRILEGAEQLKGPTELVHLSDLKIQPCSGCRACWQDQSCPFQDDVSSLYQDIAHSDVLIFGTPVYWYGPTGLIKLLLDRLIYFKTPAHEDMIKGKVAVLVVPFEEPDPETASPLVTIFEKSLADLGVELRDILLVPGLSEKGQVIKDLPLLDRCTHLGRDLAALQTRQTC